MADQHLDEMTEVRNKLVNLRRRIVNDMSMQSANLEHSTQRLIQTQEAIEALDRAFQDENALRANEIEGGQP